MRHDVVLIDAEPITVAKRSRMVLAVLVQRANETVTSDHLIDALWGDHPPRSARNSISRFVLDARRAIEPFADRLQSVPGGYRLSVLHAERDIDRIERGLTSWRAQRNAPTTSSSELAALVAELSPLVALAGSQANMLLLDLHGYEAIERGQAEVRIAVTEALGNVLYLQGDHASVITLIEPVLDQHPYHERFWELLMAALHETGRSAEALVAAQRLRTILDELGVAPADPIQQLEDHIRAQLTEREPLPPSATPAMPNSGLQRRAPIAEPQDSDTDAGRSSQHDIAHPGTPLIGRIGDVRRVHKLLETNSVVSIIGLGGSGKTRVALQTIEAIRTAGTPTYEAGLSSITEPRLVVQVIAQVLGVPAVQATDAESLARSVSSQSFVLLIDNCEHLVDACADVVHALAVHAPGVRVLTTSREALGIADERVDLLPALSLQDNDGDTAQSAALALVLDRAGPRLDPSDPEQLDYAQRICARLGGLPLAIEIAAAQLAYMSLAQLFDRINAAFDTDQSANEPAVRVVEHILDWAWHALSPSQQALLARLSIFASGWTIEAAEAVRAGPGSLQADMDRLVANALIERTTYRGTTRYAILAPVREFAEQRMRDRGETQVMADRLVTWIQQSFAKYSLPEHHMWHHPNAELLPELGNLTAALAHLETQGRKEEFVMLSVAASGMMVNSGFAQDCIRLATPYLEDSDVSAAGRSAAHLAVCTGLHAVGDFELLTPYGERGIALAAGEPHDWMPIMAGYFSVWSLVAPSVYSTPELLDIAKKAAESSDSRQSNLAICALYRGHVEFVSRNYGTALELFREAVSLIDHPGRGLLVAEIGVSLSLYMLSRTEEAVASVESWQSESDTDHWHYIVDVFRAIIIGGCGAPESATAELANAVRSLPSATTWWRAGIVQTAFAMLADFRGEPDLAEELFASAVNRDILLLSVAISHVMNTRELSGDEAWLEVGIEFWTRIVPQDSVAATAQTTPQLLRWWTSDSNGGLSEQATPSSLIEDF